MDLDTLNRAEGYCQLCLWQEAWEAMEEMHQGERRNPEVAHLRLRIAVELEDWVAGERVADQVSGSPRVELKRTAAQYFLDRARALSGEGDSEEADRNFRKALGAWKGIQKEFTDSELDGLGPEPDTQGEGEPTSAHAIPPGGAFSRFAHPWNHPVGHRKADSSAHDKAGRKHRHRSLRNLRRNNPAGPITDNIPPGGKPNR